MSLIRKGLLLANSCSLFGGMASKTSKLAFSAVKPLNFISRMSFTTQSSKSSSILFNKSIKRSFATYSAKMNAFSASESAPKLESKWPVYSTKAVGYLCIGSSILVFAIVILGGLTRLTESGLSITEWKPVTGAIPPLNEEDWIAEFEKYKESPEFKQLNSYMELEDFKFIYGMEWSHRLLGRIIGMAFVLPTLYFIARRKVTKSTAVKLLGICGLIGVQGAIGWWMVYSGIDTDQLEARRSKPTVSPYRLATHLGAAFIVYCAMISTGFNVLRNHWIQKQPQLFDSYFKLIQSSKIQPFKRLSAGVLGLVFLTAMSGAFVAGLDAGLIYNTFPKMGDTWIPSKQELFDPVFARLSDQSDLIWRNMLENQTTVQLEHRILATTAFLAVFAIHMFSHRIRGNIPRPAYKWLNISMGAVSAQYVLGMCTLLMLVPTHLAATHQAGALTLLTTMLLVVNNLKKPSKANLKVLEKCLETIKKSSGKPLN